MDRVQLLWVAQGHTLPSAGVKTHRHPYYHMFYITAGNCNFTVEGTEYALQQGQCLLVPRDGAHSYCNPTEEILEYLEVKFSLPQTTLEPTLVKMGTIVSDNELVGLLIRQILQEYSDMGGLADDSAASYLESVLNLLTQSKRYQKKPRSRFIDSSEFSELSQRIIRYLESHYSEDFSLDSLAEAIDYNKSYLCVAFKKDTRMTIWDCLNTIRIRRAAELIVYSDHSIPQVAAQCGFASVSHFNRVFLKYVGTTPSQCRRATPGHIMFSNPEKHISSAERPNLFVYSVLAHRQITVEMLKKMDDSKPVEEE